MQSSSALRVQFLCEDSPGLLWNQAFARSWPGYKQWFTRSGGVHRPSFLECERALSAHMPELVPLWETLIDAVGGADGDLVARFLALYCPPPYLSGCSQAAWTRAPYPLLVRNYDYVPELWEARLWQTRWLGHGVLGMSDCLWGLLDGINDDGLAVSLAFGGSRTVGIGFGIPLILRYVLQTCATTREAVGKLCTIPCNMAYNVTLIDADGRFETVHLAPDRPATVTHHRVATNHQGRVEWSAHAIATASVDRFRTLCGRIRNNDETAERFLRRFLEPPLFVGAGPQTWRTLYTAVYLPHRRSLSLLWPDGYLQRDLNAASRDYA